MKKTLTVLILLVLTIIISVQVGCGSFNPPQNTPDPTITDNTGGSTGGDEEDGHDVFRVFLVDEDGRPFYPPQPIFAQWSGEEGVYSAQVSERGFAQILDLDGDYRVTLSSLPSSYTYDPNNNFVDNVTPDITIEIKKILGSYNALDGSGQYRQAQLSQLGTYRVTLGSKSDGVFFSFTPRAGGIYSIESWADITANIVNPIVDEYNGTFAWNTKKGTVDGGGSESTYTKNFRMEMQLNDDEVGNTKIFAVHADTIGNNYPVSFDFTIKYEGRPPENVEVYEEVKAKGPFNTGENMDVPTGTFTYIYAETGILDEDLVIFNPDDKYYHVYDPVTKTMGGLLYARISTDSALLMTESGMGFKDSYIKLQFNGCDYSNFIEAYANSCQNGVHPVTEELKNFLFQYAVKERYFADGNGWAETIGLNSGEDDQWLFCCGYYA